MTATASSTQPAFWNIVSLAIPGAAFLAGVVILRTSRSSDYAGAIGDVLVFGVAMSVFGALGESAAVASLCRGERLAGLSILGALLNAVLLIPGLLFLIHKAGE